MLVFGLLILNITKEKFRLSLRIRMEKTIGELAKGETYQEWLKDTERIWLEWTEQNICDGLL